MRFNAFALGLTLSAPALAETPMLTIMAYDSFAKYAGPPVAAAFEETCGCEVEMISLGGSGELVPRVLAEAEALGADVVVGIETNTLARAAKSGLFAPHGIDLPALDLPVDWQDPAFIPVNWGYYAFIYDAEKVTDPPGSFEDLIASDLTVVIQNPHTSTTGLGLLMWVEAAYGARAPEIWNALAPRLRRVVPTWADAYHPIFRQGGADMVLSYSTSPAYHIIEEGIDTLRAAAFEEGHYVRLEVAGMLASSDVPDLARDFLAFVHMDAFQSALPTTRWLYPAKTPEGGLPPAFATLIAPERALLLPPDETEARREPALAAWREALGR